MISPKEIAEKIIKGKEYITSIDTEPRILARAYLELEKENDRLKNYEIAGYEEMHNEMKAEITKLKEEIDILKECHKQSVGLAIKRHEEITKLKKSREELRKFVDHCCSWNEGEVVTGRFDSPWTAREAREALKADDELMKEGE